MSSYSEGYDTEQEEEYKKYRNSELDQKIKNIVTIFEQQNQQQGMAKDQKKQDNNNNQIQGRSSEILKQLKELQFKINDNTMYVQCQLEQQQYQEQQIKNALNFIQELENQQKQSKQKIEELEYNLESEQNINSELQLMLDNFQNKDSLYSQEQVMENKQYQDQIQKLQQTILKMDDKIDELQKSKQNAVQDNQRLCQNLEENSGQLKKYQDQLSDIKNHKKNNSCEFSVQTDVELIENEHLMKKQMKNLEKQNQNKIEEIQFLQQKLQLLEGKQEESQQILNELEDQKNQLQEQVQENYYKNKIRKSIVINTELDSNQFLAQFTPNGTNVVIYGEDDNQILKAEVQQPQKISDFMDNNDQMSSSNRQQFANEDCFRDSERTLKVKCSSASQNDNNIDFRTTTDPSPFKTTESKQYDNNKFDIQIDEINNNKESLLIQQQQLNSNKSTNDSNYQNISQKLKDKANNNCLSGLLDETQLDTLSLNSHKQIENVNIKSASLLTNNKQQVNNQQTKKRDQNMCGCTIM